jgi:Protein of unknown function (DUF3349)
MDNLHRVSTSQFPTARKGVHSLLTRHLRAVSRAGGRCAGRGGSNYHREIEDGFDGAGGDAVSRFLDSIVNWLRAGYPDGVPETDYMPVLALLTRRLSSVEAKDVAAQLMKQGEFDDVDIGVAITQITDELPSPNDVERVRQRLAAKGWPLDDPRDEEDDE